MDRNDRVFYGTYDDPQEPQNGLNGAMPGGGYEDGYGDGYDDGYGGGYDDGYGQPYDEAAMDGYDGGNPEGGDYSVYDGEGEPPRRFHLAMNVLDTVGVLAGVVVILALTALIISLVSWVSADITHSFVILQSRIQ